MNIPKAKHPQSILATLASMYDSIISDASGMSVLGPDGFLVHDFLQWAILAQPTHIIAQRTMLEFNNAFRQILPYTVLLRQGHNGHEYLAYQRTKKGGEPKLNDKVSIGWAGHIDLKDVVYNSETSTISVLATFVKALIREMGEELWIKDRKGATVSFLQAFYAKTSSALLLQDTDPEIYHAGLVTFLEVREGYTYDVNEEELTFLGWMTADELLAQYDDELEAWSKTILKNEGLAIDHTNFRSEDDLDALDYVDRLTYFVQELTGVTTETRHDLINLLGGNSEAADDHGYEANLRETIYLNLGEMTPKEADGVVSVTLQEAQLDALKACMRNLGHTYSNATLMSIINNINAANYRKQPVEVIDPAAVG